MHLHFCVNSGVVLVWSVPTKVKLFRVNGRSDVYTVVAGPFTGFQFGERRSGASSRQLFTYERTLGWALVGRLAAFCDCRCILRKCSPEMCPDMFSGSEAQSRNRQTFSAPASAPSERSSERCSDQELRKINCVLC